MTALLTLYARLIIPQRQSWFAIPLRLIIGYGFMEHGYAKLARGPESFAAILHTLGMPAPALLAWATILVELFGGLMVLVGALVPLASIPMIVVLLVAIFTVHVPNGFSSIKLQSVDAMGAHFGQPGYETDLLYVAGLIALVLGGSGPLALDRLFLARMVRAEDSKRRRTECGFAPPTCQKTLCGRAETLSLLPRSLRGRIQDVPPYRRSNIQPRSSGWGNQEVGPSTGEDGMRTSLLAVAALVPLFPVPAPLFAQVLKREDNIWGWHDHQPPRTTPPWAVPVKLAIPRQHAAKQSVVSSRVLGKHRSSSQRHIQ